MRTCVVNALDELLANNAACAAVVIERLEWFGRRICSYLRTNGGRHAVCGSAAGIIASLSRDEEAAVKLVSPPCHLPEHSWRTRGEFSVAGLGSPRNAECNVPSGSSRSLTTQPSKPGIYPNPGTALVQSMGREQPQTAQPS